MAEPPTFEDAHDNNCTLKTKTLSSGPIKVNMKFSLSFLGVSFSGLVFLGFRAEIHFIFQFQGFSYVSAIADYQILVSYKAQQSNPGF